MAPSLPRQQRTIDASMKCKSLQEMEKMVDEESVISNMVKCKPEMASKLINRGGGGDKRVGIEQRNKFP